MRLDKFLVDNGYYYSRNQAIEAIKSGFVKVEGKIIKKPSFDTAESMKIELIQTKQYVSRASGKLLGYLKSYPLDLSRKRALDIGSSTGGFTQVLLEYGVDSVTAIDVGKEQFHPTLRKESRVKLYEETDIRGFVAEAFDVIVSDVSFISLGKIIDDIDRLAKNKSDIILLFKPQFEVGKDVKRDKRGVVTDRFAIQNAQIDFENNISRLNWNLIRKVDSKVVGKSGNQEIIYHYQKII